MTVREVQTLVALLKRARDEHGMVLPADHLGGGHWPERQIDEALRAVRQLERDGRWYAHSALEVRP